MSYTNLPLGKHTTSSVKAFLRCKSRWALSLCVRRPLLKFVAPGIFEGEEAEDNLLDAGEVRSVGEVLGDLGFEGKEEKPSGKRRLQRRILE